MGLWELFVLAVGLSMDAFSVAVCKGLSVCQIRKKQILTVGLYFGFFQGFMPLVGYLLGTGFQEKIQSIDPLAVGVTFAFLKVQIIPAVSFIGITTFVISCAGVLIGNRFGAKYKSKAEIAGGIVLILMGVKILLEHTILA